jgi:hypothetical protein
MFDLKDYRFVKVILASTAVDKSGDKISMKALNDLQRLCLNKTGTIEIPEYKTDCTIVNSFICSSNESDGTGEVAYNLYGILAFNAQSISGKYISDRIDNLGNNLCDWAKISFIIGASEKMNDTVRQILDIKDFVSFAFDVRSMESVRNQEKLNEVIKKSDICPFCGSKPIVTVDGENISGLDKFRVTIKCLNIECNVQPKTSFYDSSFTTACDMVLKHWNHRTSDSGIIDTRCCVNCVNCHKDDNEMYYCINDNHYIPALHPFKHTNCDDFEQKDSNNLYCVSNEDVSETETIEDGRSLCLSCVNAEFDKDGCYCKHLVRFVKCIGCKSCQYYEKG